MCNEDGELVPNNWVKCVVFLELLISLNLLLKQLERDIEIRVASPKKTRLDHVSSQISFAVDKGRTACSVFWRESNAGGDWAAGPVAGNSL